jgi:N-acetylmuramoyl-L-alanine amidase
MARLVLVAGHGQGDPGAVGNGYRESDLNRRVSQDLFNITSKSVPTFLYNHNKDLFQQNNYSDFKAGDKVIEIHFNSASATATGTEILIKEGYTPDKMDNELLTVLSKHFTNRGFKYRELRNMNKFSELRIDYRLLEICFISNPNDMKQFEKIYGNLIKELAEVMVVNCGGSKLTVNTSKPHGSAIGEGISTLTEYKVDEGDLRNMKRTEIENIVRELYYGITLREPDAGGLKYWSDLLQKGTSFASVFNSFVNEKEIVERYVLEVLYKGLLKRNVNKTDDGFKYWVGRILNKEITKAQAYQAFIVTPEYKALKK